MESTIPSITHSMKFNHISFPSRDVPATAAFFAQHLGCTLEAMGSSRVLKRHDFDIVIEDAADRAVNWPGNFHIGFELPSAQDVRALFQRFQAAGVTLATQVIAHARGSRFFAEVPGGVLVEINTREDAAAPYRAGFGRA